MWAFLKPIVCRKMTAVEKPKFRGKKYQRLVKTLGVEIFNASFRPLFFALTPSNYNIFFGDYPF
jgi:hypothetical protein